MSSSKRHFTAVIGKKEQGSYASSSPSSAARKAVSKLCADDKNRKVEFYMRENYTEIHINSQSEFIMATF
jgi:hypothetical protein